jgi:hypothetical protein
VIDYTREDFTKNGRTYDVIFDAWKPLQQVKARQTWRRHYGGFENLPGAGLSRRRQEGALPDPTLHKRTVPDQELVEAGNASVSIAALPAGGNRRATRYVGRSRDRECGADARGGARRCSAGAAGSGHMSALVLAARDSPAALGHSLMRNPVRSVRPRSPAELPRCQSARGPRPAACRDRDADRCEDLRT